MSGACMLVRRKAIDATGGFDPEFFLYFEDFDWSVRLEQGRRRPPTCRRFASCTTAAARRARACAHIGWFVQQRLSASTASTAGDGSERAARCVVTGAGRRHRRGGLRRRASRARICAPFRARGARGRAASARRRAAAVVASARSRDRRGRRARRGSLEGASAVVHLAGARARDAARRAPIRRRRISAANVVATARLAQRRGARRRARGSCSRARSRSTAKRRRRDARSAPDDPPAPQRRVRAEQARRRARARPRLRRHGVGAGRSCACRWSTVPAWRGNFLALRRRGRARAPLPLGAIGNRRSVLGVGNLVDAIDAALDAPRAAARRALRRRRRERVDARARARDRGGARRRRRGCAGPGAAARGSPAALPGAARRSSASTESLEVDPVVVHRRPPAGRRGTRSRTGSRRRRGGGGCGMRSDDRGLRRTRRYNRSSRPLRERRMSCPLLPAGAPTSCARCGSPATTRGTPRARC